MSNHLNIDFDNFGNDKTYEFIDDPIVYVREAGDTGDPIAIGYTKIGKQFKISREYAETYTGIPQNLVRKDMVKQKIEFETEVYQFEPDLLALALNATIDTSTGSVTRVVLGSDTPAVLDINVAIIGQDVSGRYVGVYIRCLNIATEDFTLALGGTEHGSFVIKGVCMIDDDPETNSYGWEYDEDIDNDDIAFIKFTASTVAQP